MNDKSPLPVQPLKLLLLFLTLAFQREPAHAISGARVLDSLRSIYVSVIPTGDVYIVNQGELFAIFSRDGKALTPFAYGSLTPGHKGRFVANRNLLIDSAGRYIAWMHSGNNDAPPRLEEDRYIYAQDDSKSIYDADGRSIAYLNTYKPWADLGFSSYSGPGGCHGIQDTSGRIVLPADCASRFSVGKTGIVMTLHDTAYAFDLRGRLRFRTYAHEAQQMARGVVAIKLYNNWSLRDSVGAAITGFDHYATGYVDPELEWINIGAGNFNTDGNWIGPGGKRPAANDIVSRTSMDYGLSLIRRAGRLSSDIIDEQGRELVSGLTQFGWQSIGNRYVRIGSDYEDRPRIFDLQRREFTSRLIESSPANGRFVVVDPEKQERQFYRGDQLQTLPVFTDIVYLQQRRFYILLRDKTKFRGYRADSRDREDAAAGASMNPDAKKGPRYGLADSNLKLLLEPEYSRMAVLGDSLIYGFRPADSSTVFFDGNGRELARVRGIMKMEWGAGFLTVENSAGALVIDREASRILFRGHTLPRAIASGDWKTGMPYLMLVTDSADRPGIYNSSGQRVLAGNFELATSVAPGIRRFRRGDSSYFVSAAGAVLFAGRGIAGERLLPTSGYVLLLADGRGRWGAIDASGREVYPFEWDSAGVVNPRDWVAAQRYFLQNGNRRIILDNAGRPIPPGDSARIMDGLRMDYGQRRQLLAWLQPEGGTPGLYNGRLQRLSEFKGRYDDNHGELAIIYDTLQKTAFVIDTNGTRVSPVVAISSRFEFALDGFMILNADGREGQLCRQMAGGWTAEPIALVPESSKRYRGVHFSGGPYIFDLRTGGKGVYWNGRIYVDRHADEIEVPGDVMLVQRGSKWSMFNRQLVMLQPSTADRIYRTKDYRIMGIDSGGKMGLFDTETGIRIPPGYDEFYDPTTLKDRFVMARRGDSFYVLGPGGSRLTPALNRIRLRNPTLRNIPAVLNGAEAVVTTGPDGIVRTHPAAGPPVLKPGLGRPYEPVVIVDEGGKKGLFSNLQSRYLLAPEYDHIEPVERGFIASRYKPDRLEGVDSTLVFNKDGRLLVGVKGAAGMTRSGNGIWRMPRESEYRLGSDDGRPGPVVTSDGQILVAPDSGYALFGEELYTVGSWTAEGIIRSDGIWTLPQRPGQVITRGKGRFGIGRLKKRYFLIDDSGHQLTKAVYRLIVEKGGVYSFRRGLRRGVFDQNGRERVKQAVERR